MKKIRTHYDNLKVARDAPPEVIRAAYRTLSQKYHPDRNPGDPESARVMSIINASYDILSNEEKRRQHDQSIASQELNNSSYSESGKVPTKQNYEQTSKPLKLKQRIYKYLIISHLFRYWILYFIALVIVISVVTEKPAIPPPGPKPYQRTPPKEIPKYIKPLTAPNGEYWPSVAGYVKGYPRLKTGGYSKVTIDNSGNDCEVYVKLISLDGVKAYPVRQFYIPAFGKFTLNKVNAGNYDIRYRDLNSGHLSRAETFSLYETKTDEGIHYRSITMTLFKVQNGNMQTFNLSEEEF